MPSLVVSGTFDGNPAKILGTFMVVRFFTNSANTTSGWNMTARKYLDGGWSSWSDYDTCTGTCPANAGTQSRYRTCSNPAPLNGGASCNGSNIETVSCNAFCSYMPLNQSRFDIGVTAENYRNGMNAFWFIDQTADLFTSGFLITLTSGQTEVHNLTSLYHYF